MEKEGKGWAISREEATTVNTNVTLFNNTISDLIAQCRADGMNIHFVSVDACFTVSSGDVEMSTSEVIEGTEPKEGM